VAILLEGAFNHVRRASSFELDDPADRTERPAPPPARRTSTV